MIAVNMYQFTQNWSNYMIASFFETLALICTNILLRFQLQTLHLNCFKVILVFIHVVEIDARK